MAEITLEQKERLKVTVDEGEIIRSFCLHPGFKLFQETLESIVADKKKTWLRGSKDEAESARNYAQGVDRALAELKKFILSGQQARNILVDEAKNSALAGTDSAS